MTPRRAKAKKELVLGFYGQIEDDGRVIYSESGWTDFSDQDIANVKLTGIRLQKSLPAVGYRDAHEERLLINQVWSDPNGFEIVDYGKSTSTAYFTVMFESDMKADIKIDMLYELVKAKKIRDGRVFADLTFRAFGGSKYLVEI